MDNLMIYEQARAVPQSALKPITAGRLKGKSDINPMWRIKRLTELFGPCGIGWKYTITREWLERGANNEIAAFVDIELRYRLDGEWSEPIPGTGGSAFVASERSGLYTSDECYKMALTDAISVACKALGIGADVYWQADSTKYDRAEQPPRQPEQPKYTPPDVHYRCEECGKELHVYQDANGKPVGLRKHAERSKAKFGAVLCLDCIARRQQAELDSNYRAMAEGKYENAG